MYFEWQRYVPVAERKRKAAREASAIRKHGEALAPVVLSGRTIAQTFWGKAWCQNLERYSDYANRLPRGRTYVRNGSVIDLRITAGQVTALVSGSSLYKVRAEVSALDSQRWQSICRDCAGAIDTLVELLQARFSQGIMERMCRHESGLFPAPKEIRFSCSCPDWASMCKHVAAVLYGIGARLDQQPELLFLLRKVDHAALIAAAGTELKLGDTAPSAARVLDGPDLSALFGIELAEPAKASARSEPVATAQRPSTSGAAKKKAARRAAASPGQRKTAAKQRAERRAPRKSSKAGAEKARASAAGREGSSRSK